MSTPDNPLRIMIVEDQALVALDMRDVIEGTEDIPSAVVFTAADTKEALEGAREMAPDAAFIDANLRDGRTGPDIAAMLQQRHGISVVLATSYPEDFEGTSVRPVCVLTKPVAPDSLHEALARLDRIVQVRNQNGSAHPGA